MTDMSSTRPLIRRSIEDQIERLLAMLDALDGDADLEPDNDGEPWLGWPDAGPEGPHGISRLAKDVAHDDREEQNEDGSDINDEPQDDNELEPNLGRLETIHQGAGSYSGHEPGEVWP